MLVELAIADAYASHFQDMDDGDMQYIKEYNVPSYLSLPRRIRYTAPTQMVIALARTVIENPDFNRHDLATNLMKIVAKDPERGGYSRNIKIALDMAVVNDDATKIMDVSKKQIYAYAAIRGLPLGILSTPDAVIDKASVAASLTNIDGEALDATCIVGLASYWFMRNGNSSGLRKFLMSAYPRSIVLKLWKGEVESTDMAVLRAGIAAVYNANSLTDALEQVVSYGGDIRSSAAITAGFGAIITSINNDIRQVLGNKIHWGNTHYTLSGLQLLDKSLTAKLEGSC